MSEIRVDNITDEEGTGSPNIIYDNAASGLTATSIKGAIDEVSEQTVNSQELLAGVSEAADIDEAVSFIGRGAIVESGSNSNGYYVRWENGDQVCFTRALFSLDTDGETWTYPSDFTESDSLIIQMSDEGASTGHTFSVNNITTSSANLIASSGVNLWNVFAWGFWK